MHGPTPLRRLPPLFCSAALTSRVRTMTSVCGVALLLGIAGFAGRHLGRIYAPRFSAPLLALLLLALPVAYARAGLFVISANTGQVLEYDGTTGAPVGNGVFVGNAGS